MCGRLVAKMVARQGRILRVRLTEVLQVALIQRHMMKKKTFRLKNYVCVKQTERGSFTHHSPFQPRLMAVNFMSQRTRG